MPLIWLQNSTVITLHIRGIEFQSIPFRSIEVPGRHFLKGGVDVRGLPIPEPHQKTTPLYIIPQRRMNTLSGDH